MREDSRVLPGIAFLAVTVLIDAADFAEAYWRAAPDPTWETRWRALDPAESAWLAMMAGSRDWINTLTDPEEIELARGFYRHERRYRVYFDLAALPLMIAAGVLALAGVLRPGALGLVAGAFVALRGLALYLREKQIKKTYEQAKADYQGMTAADPAPAP